MLYHSIGRHKMRNHLYIAVILILVFAVAGCSRRSHRSSTIMGAGHNDQYTLSGSQNKPADSAVEESDQEQSEEPVTADSASEFEYQIINRDMPDQAVSDQVMVDLGEEEPPVSEPEIMDVSAYDASEIQSFEFGDFPPGAIGSLSGEMPDGQGDEAVETEESESLAAGHDLPVDIIRLPEGYDNSINEDGSDMVTDIPVPNLDLIPEGWPEDISIVPGFMIQYGTRSENVMQVVASGDAQVDEVLGYYSVLSGWIPQDSDRPAEMLQGEGGIPVIFLELVKEDNHLEITIFRENETTVFQLVYYLP